MAADVARERGDDTFELIRHAIILEAKPVANDFKYIVARRGFRYICRK